MSSNAPALQSTATCHACGAAVDDALCAACNALQPPGQLDHFARLGLPRDFAIGEKALERAYFAAQRRFHPDRFAGRGAKEKTLSLQHATLINEAYETLREPLARARHLLESAGRPLPGDDGKTIADTELLMEAMEWREALDEATDLVALARRIEAETGAVVARLGQAFGADDLDGATREALRLSYLTKLGQELRRKLAPRAALS